MGFLLTAVMMAVGGLTAGWKIAKRRGSDPAKRPSFRTRGQYLRRCALRGAIANFIITYGIWFLLGITTIANGTYNMGQIALIALAPAVLFAPAGALLGLIYGWLWYQVDVLRRLNHPETAPQTPPAVQTAPTQAPAGRPMHTIPPFESLNLPSDLGATRLPNSTGDALWDDFHKTAPSGR